MKIEEVQKALKDLGLCSFDNTEEQNRSIQRQTLYLTMILQLEADKLELSKAIVEDNTLYYFTEDGENGGKYCGKCGLDYPNHSDDCIVNKATKYLGERSERD